MSDSANTTSASIQERRKRRLSDAEVEAVWKKHEDPLYYSNQCSEIPCTLDIDHHTFYIQAYQSRRKRSLE
jgi:hypothetical protein